MSKVALIKGNSRRQNVLNSLNLIADQIKERVKGKTILIKPNFVSTTTQKAATHIDHIRGILDFLSSFYQGKVIIAEGACGDTFRGFKNFGYFSLKEEYPFEIEFIDLNKDRFKEVQISNGRSVRVSRTILEPSYFIISAAKLKTHDTVIATLSLKNLVMGMIIGGDKFKVHQGIREINRNLLLLAKERSPDLASIDGFYGMEGEGPIIGDLVECKVAIASIDFLAADRTGLEIMGIDPEDVGYLVYSWKEGLGEYDLDKIKIVGNSIKNCKFKRKFKMHSRIKQMLRWKEEGSTEGLGSPIFYGE